VPAHTLTMTMATIAKAAMTYTFSISHPLVEAHLAERSPRIDEERILVYRERGRVWLLPLVPRRASIFAVIKASPTAAPATATFLINPARL
jgi:hypothetical protein